MYTVLLSNNKPKTKNLAPWFLCADRLYFCLEIWACPRCEWKRAEKTLHHEQNWILIIWFWSCCNTNHFHLSNLYKLQKDCYRFSVHKLILGEIILAWKLFELFFRNLGLHWKSAGNCHWFRWQSTKSSAKC